MVDALDGEVPVTTVRTIGNFKRAIVLGREATEADNVDADSIADVIMQFTDDLLRLPGYYPDADAIATPAAPLPTAWEMAADLLEEADESFASVVVDIVEEAICEYADARLQKGAWHDLWVESQGAASSREVAVKAAKRIVKGLINELGLAPTAD